MEHTHIAKLVRDFQAGDEKAFDKLYSSLYSSQYYYAYKIIGDRYAAEDIVQEAWVKVYQNINKLEKPQAFAKWLTKITHFTCVDYLRSKKPEEYTVDMYSDKMVEKTEASGIHGHVEDEASRTVNKVGVKDAIDKLPQKYKSVVLLRYYCNYKTREIADILGVPEGTIKSELNTARTLLKKRLYNLYSLAPMWGIMMLYFGIDAGTLVGAAAALPGIALGTTITKTIAVTTVAIAGAGMLSTQTVQATVPPAITDIVITDYREAATSQNIEVKVDSPVDIESVVLSDGTTLLQTDTGYEADITANGTYTVTVTDTKGRSTHQSITLDNIDNDAPSVEVYQQDDILIIDITDATSGIDWDSLKADSQGEGAVIEPIGRDGNRVRYPVSSAPLHIEVSDRAGNIKMLNIG